MQKAILPLLLCVCLFAIGYNTHQLLAADKVTPPAVGDTATDFELKSIAGDTVKLSKAVEDGSVVVMVLRGNPGYQCPLCTKQVAEFIGKADDIKIAGAKVLLVYPGPSGKLQAKAEEFVKGKDYPVHFTLLLDPDYAFTKAYGLRWDAKNETAYPSTFVVDKKLKVTFAKVSKEHGDRAKATDVLKALSAK
jgi:thioredoxin-dependent peroxiredoxin